MEEQPGDDLRLGECPGQLITRYIDGMEHANTVTGGSPLTNTSVGSVWYWDLMGVYELTANLTLRGRRQQPVRRGSATLHPVRAGEYRSVAV